MRYGKYWFEELQAERRALSYSPRSASPYRNQQHDRDLETIRKLDYREYETRNDRDPIG